MKSSDPRRAPAGLEGGWAECGSLSIKMAAHGLNVLRMTDVTDADALPRVMPLVTDEFVLIHVRDGRLVVSVGPVDGEA